MNVARLKKVHPKVALAMGLMLEEQDIITFHCQGTAHRKCESMTGDNEVKGVSLLVRRLSWPSTDI
jgi:hypothetical protein